jgi:hypothetical protein
MGGSAVAGKDDAGAGCSAFWNSLPSDRPVPIPRIVPLPRMPPPSAPAPGSPHWPRWFGVGPEVDRRPDDCTGGLERCRRRSSTARSRSWEAHLRCRGVHPLRLRLGERERARVSGSRCTLGIDRGAAGRAQLHRCIPVGRDEAACLIAAAGATIGTRVIKLGSEQPPIRCHRSVCRS